MNVILQRIQQTKRSTSGVLFYGHPLCYTLEPLWKQNQNYISSIPSGLYPTVKEPYHHRFGRVFRLSSIPNRSGILIHVGNVPEETSGCILVGLDSRVDRLITSRMAIDKLYNHLPDKFILEVRDGF